MIQSNPIDLLHDTEAIACYDVYCCWVDLPGRNQRRAALPDATVAWPAATSAGGISWINHGQLYVILRAAMAMDGSSICISCRLKQAQAHVTMTMCHIAVEPLSRFLRAYC